MGLPLSADDLGRLGKLLGMLGSDADDERAFAGAKADALLRERGTTWSDLIHALQAISAPAEQCHRADARECLEVLGVWSPKEMAFLMNMPCRRREPTLHQAEWLARLLDEARLIARENA